MTDVTYIRSKIEHLENRYNPEHDMFEDAIQMNYIDFELLKIINYLLDEIESLYQDLSFQKREYLSVLKPETTSPKIPDNGK